MRRYIRQLIHNKRPDASGVTRDVYYLDRGRVLKVAKSDHGIYSNQVEVNLYNSCPPAVKKHLGQIIDNGRSWIIMRRYDRRVPKSRKYETKLKEIIAEFQRNSIIPSDTRNANLRLYNGRIIVIDYGNFKKTP